MKKRLKFSLFIVAGILLILAGLFLIVKGREAPESLESRESLEMLEVDEQIIEEQNDQEEKVVKKRKEKKVQEPEVEIVIPENINLDVPFTCQAPYQNWNMPWQEACEEAALMMIDHYLQGMSGKNKDDQELLGKEMLKDQANAEILEMVDWQEKNWGGHYDLPAEDIARLAREYYGYNNVEVKYDITVEDIKEEVGQGNPVLLPSAGRMLANPHFTAPGPVYHNLVVAGYDENGFIVNDPGVWQGHKFRYSFDNLYNSIHDFVAGASKTSPDLILGGRKVMVAVRN